VAYQYVRRTAIPTALIALLLVPGCATGPGANGQAPPTSAGASVAAPGFGGTDLAWLQLSIAMDEALLPLLDLAPAHSDDPAVRAFAARVRATYESELVTSAEAPGPLRPSVPRLRHASTMAYVPELQDPVTPVDRPISMLMWRRGTAPGARATATTVTGARTDR
jgi:hypothetical protein